MRVQRLPVSNLNPRRVVQMDEANQSLPQAPTQAQSHTMRAAVIALARREALKAIKRQMQAKALRLSQIPHKIIVAAADYLAQHRSALIADAKAIVERWHAEGMIGSRGAIRNPPRMASQKASPINDPSAMNAAIQ
jgi:hypothetical protein